MAWAVLLTAVAAGVMPVSSLGSPVAAADRVEVIARHIPVVPVTSGRSERAGGWLRPATKVRRIVLVGDSLAKEMAPFLQFLTYPRDLTARVWGGTAPCDWTSSPLGADRATLVIVSFTGNSLTQCMTAPDGSLLQGEQVVEQYRYDVGQIIDSARRTGARVLLVGQPLPMAVLGVDAVVDGINQMYRTYAAKYPFVAYVDAGAAVESPDGAYTDRLPCTRFDPDCGPDGTTIVRGDGVHFCPALERDPCLVWSSGAFRFGMAVAVATNSYRRYE
jgi:hypothetical protein